MIGGLRAGNVEKLLVGDTMCGFRYFLRVGTATSPSSPATIALLPSLATATKICDF